MGLFGGSKTYVSSVLYNLAGDEVDRPSYLKSTVMGAILYPRNANMSFGGVIRESYIQGPGIQMRSFFRWAQDHYDDIGVPTGTLGGATQIDSEIVADAVPVDPGHHADVSLVDYGTGDYSVWAEQWMLENHPDLIDTDWTSDISAGGVITVTFEDTTTATFTPTDFELGSIYIYTLYNEITPAVVGTGTEEAPEFPEVVGPDTIWIYKFGSGHTELDDMIIEGANNGEYLPFIPIRINNQFLSETYEPAAYALAKKAYKRASRAKFDKLIEKIADNENLDDIDYAYVMYGVPLNVVEQASRQYLYRFFEKLRLSNTESNEEFVLWQEAGGLVAPPTNSVRIKSTGTLDTNVNMNITWNSIAESTGEGEGKPGAKEGEYWLEAEPGVGILGNRIKIWWQETETSWRALTVIGAKHDNLIYNNKSVTILATEALDDEEISGFLVPLHFGTVQEMSLIDRTQMGTACSYLVLNCYEVVKLKWYQTGIFKIIVFVAVVAITVVTAGAGAPLVGILGTAASVGAAIGLTGTLALIAGAIINAVVAMILMKLIMAGAVAIFGEKIGQIIGVIVSLVTLNVGQSIMNGASLATAWGSLMSASNIMQLTNAVTGGVTAYVQAGAAETLEAGHKLLEDSQRQIKELQEKFAREFGYGRATLDPLSLTDGSIGNALENEATFLSRTLMTGTDIAQMSHDMLTNFASLTLTLERA